MNFSKLIKNALTLFLVVMLLTSCSGSMNMKTDFIPIDAVLGDGFQYGIFEGFIVFPIGIIINFLTTNVFGNAGLAMIVTTIIVRSISMPVTIKGQYAMKETQKLQPLMQDIEEKYRGRTDEAAKGQKATELQQLYSKNGVNPLSGMLYPFLSMPLFFGVYRATSVSKIIRTSEYSNFLGFNLDKAPGAMFQSGNYTYVILMLLVGASQYAQLKISNNINQKRTAKPGSHKPSKQADAINKQMKMMTTIFPVMMIFMSYGLPAAMSIYLTTSALISIAQSYYIEYKMNKEA